MQIKRNGIEMSIDTLSGTQTRIHAGLIKCCSYRCWFSRKIEAFMFLLPPRQLYAKGRKIARRRLFYITARQRDRRNSFSQRAEVMRRTLYFRPLILVAGFLTDLKTISSGWAHVCRRFMWWQYLNAQRLALTLDINIHRGINVNLKTPLIEITLAAV